MEKKTLPIVLIYTACLATILVLAGCGAGTVDTPGRSGPPALVVEAYCRAAMENNREAADGFTYRGPHDEPLESGADIWGLNGYKYLEAGEITSRVRSGKKVLTCTAKAAVFFPPEWSQASGVYRFEMIDDGSGGWKILSIHYQGL